ncbi:MAG: hypothetical protein M3N12_05635, partial [Verrucomicrobiota bacterium]|nr:hypothetical protein [Verrucomicrobiota bacterium]
LQYFFILVLLAIIPTSSAAELRVGNVYPLTFSDVDRQALSTADGHATIVTVVTRKDEQKAQQVGDRIPHAYMGDPKFRLITIVNFQQSIFVPFRGMIMAIIRSRLDAEGKDLQKIYNEKHLTRNARSDILVVADFDGKSVSLLGIAPTSPEFAVFVFDGRGKLIRRWNEVPSAEAIAAALGEAR